MVWWWSTLAFGAPYYETRELRASGATATDSFQRQQLARDLRRRDLTLTLRAADGTERHIRSDSLRLWPGVAAFVRFLLDGADPGAEVDRVLHVDEDGFLELLTLRWEPDRVVVEQARVPRNPRPDGPSAEALTKQYGVGPLVDSAESAWDPRTRGLLRDALEHLTPAERAALEGLPYHRVPELSIRIEEITPIAAYLRRASSAWIEVSDLALGPVAMFCGTPAAPESVSLSILVHELGHALADAGEPGVIVAAWQDGAGGETPTRYGRTDPSEGFAEAFMLHRLDPAALQRASPRAFAWFEATDLGALVGTSHAAPHPTADAPAAD